MTFTDIQNEVIDRCALTSAQAIARVGRSINEQYRWTASSVGIQTIARGVATANTTIGNQSLVFTGVEKLYSVYNPTFTPPMVLDELSFDEMRNQPLGSDPPQQFAIQLMGASTVTILLSSSPATVYSLKADAELNLVTLSGNMVPAFAESYHDLLTYWALSVEYRKQEKAEEADKMEALCEVRKGELRLFIATSAYREIYQGKTSGGPVQVFRV